MPSPHNVRGLVIAVLTEWDIPVSKVNVIVTDNGSNMVAAFKKKYTATCTTTNEEDDSEDEEER